MTAAPKVDLTNCDREPIHIPGGIQRHGAMLVCDPRTLRLNYASENVATFFGLPATPEPGAPLGGLVGEHAVHELRNAAAKASGSGLAGLVMGLQLDGVSTVVDAKVHTHQGRTFVEFEPCLDGGRSAQQALDHTHNLIRRIGLQKDVASIATAGARLVRSLLGYDRVMIYRFLHNGAGRVIAEAKAGGLPSFMNQHFPASDIPQQARWLYLLNPIRMISDSGFAPIPLVPALAKGEAPIDMSFAELRSVSPVHCEYLRNMGVAASLSISIIVDGELWGLIACHHKTPKVTALPLRIAAELFGHYFSLQIAVAERREAALAAAEARAKLDRIVAGLSSEATVTTGLFARLADFATLADSCGAGLWLDGAWRSVGDAPNALQARAMLEIAESQSPRSIWATQELSRQLADAPPELAGALAIPLSVALGDYLVLFRREEAHGIEWAGKPGKVVTATTEGDRLSPRASFETWRQEVRGRSTPWTEADLSVAEALRTYLRDVILRQGEISAEERARTEQRRRILNDELNHRVKNILTLVKSIAMQTGAVADTVAEYAAALEGRLQALAIAHDQSLNGAGGGDFAALIDTEASLHRLNGRERVKGSGPPIRLDDRAFGVLALVVHEMMTNAAKYGALSSPQGRLDIVWRLLSDGDCEVAWTESGGPKVTRPSRDGFGAKLIRSTVEYDLRGIVELNYLEAGLTARFVIPAPHVRVHADPAPQIAPLQATEAELEGLTVLVVEDQGLIAMDTEETLHSLGAADVRLSPSVADALSVLATLTPDFAILDFNLGAETAAPVAERLEGLGVPYLFTTGYSDTVMIPDSLRHVPVLRKPVSASSLSTQLTEKWPWLGRRNDGLRPA